MATKVEKIPLSQVRKLPYKTLNRMLKKMREHLKGDETVQKMFKEYGVDLEEIDLIPMKFGKLDVSAKTDHGVLIFNWKLLCDGDFLDDYSYGVHEITHWLQQTTGNKPTQSADDGSYLDNPFEQEGFQNQVEYIAKEKGPEEAEEYVEDLLEHHDIKDEEELEEKKEILMAKATDKEHIKAIKHLLSKYHPDKPTGDPAKFEVLKDELLRLQNEDAPSPVEEPKPVVPTKGHPWGDWFEKYVANSQ
jgi:hypothetical protein